MMTTRPQIIDASPAEGSPEIYEDQLVQTSHTSDDLWKVIAHDDPVTTMEFVIRVLVQVFKKPIIFAEGIMWQVHNEGQSVVDALPKPDAESRVRVATTMARLEGFPFRFTIEPNE
ncbi:MAG: ATP-dependent Clp protease adaptor ClpS [Candidatus Promineifilaceae bacterium]